MNRSILNPPDHGQATPKSKGTRQTKTTKPRSDKQRAQSRINGAKSHGPTSDGGKARSSQNAIKHCVYSQRWFGLGLEGDRVEQQIDAYEREFGASSPSEFDLCRELALVNVRLQRNHIAHNRLWETQLDFVRENSEQFASRTPHSRAHDFDLVGLVHEHLLQKDAYRRLDRQYNRLLRDFLRLRRDLHQSKREPAPFAAKLRSTRTLARSAPVLGCHLKRPAAGGGTNPSLPSAGPPRKGPNR